MAMRKPFVPPMSVAGGQGAPTIGAPTPPPMAMPHGTGAQPPQMMGGGGNPGAQGQQQPGAPPPPPPPADPNALMQAGGPMAPGNIGAMLQPKVQMQPLQPWGDQGVRPQGPQKVTLDYGSGNDAQGTQAPGLAPAAGGPGSPSGQPQGSDPLAGMDFLNGPAVQMRLMKMLGRI